MSNVEVLRFGSAEELAAAAANAWLSFLETAATAGALLVALSGGRIARNLFSEAFNLLDPPAKILSLEPPEPLRNTHFFWADERCVPPDDAESNFGIANKLLLKPLRIPQGQIHRIRGEASPANAAARAA